MKKYKLWLLFFIGIFSFTFGMIIWTITETSEAPVHEDESFLMRYADVDENYNKILESNKSFNNKYESYIYVNGKKLPLSIEDVYMSQRLFDKEAKNKKLLNTGKNSLNFEIKDKAGNIIKDPTIKVRVTRTMDHYDDMDIDKFEIKDQKYTASLDIKKEGNWNITGFIEIDGIRNSFFYKNKY